MSNKLEDRYVKADPRNLPAVETFMVYEFMTGDDRFNAPEVRGAKSNRSSRESYGDNAVGYVSLKREGAQCTVRATMCPEHKVRQKNYIIEMIINEEKKTIVDIVCLGCAASEGGCKHAFGFMMWLNRRTEEPACTDVTCYWKKSVLSGVGTNIKYMLASDMIVNYTPKNIDLPDSSAFFDEVIANLDSKQIDTQLSRYTINLIDRKVYNLSIHQILLSYFSAMQETDADDFIKFGKQTMDPILCHEVEEHTKDQSEDPFWHQIRYGRVTASKLYAVAHCKTDQGSLVKQIIGAAKVYDTVYMKRGRDLEQQMFKKLCRDGYRLSKCGFFMLPSHPIFGASPDGVAGDYILEIKCPSSDKTMKNYVHNGKVTNKYRAQMMLQMMMTQKKKGLFCVADCNFEKNEQVSLYWVEYEEEFLIPLIDQATSFWKENIYSILTKYF